MRESREGKAPQGALEIEDAGLTAMLEEHHDASSETFTATGTLPPVTHAHDDGRGGPSASERAFGPELYVESGSKGTATKKRPTFKTALGGDVEQTTRDEAAILNAIRADHRRLSPQWLLGAQKALGVADMTGAMNTETLRALIKAKTDQVSTSSTDATKPKIDAAVLLDEAFLQSLHPGAPFVAATKQDWFHHDAKNDKRAYAADKAAQAVGYEDFDDYSAEFLDRDEPTSAVAGVTFLGVSLAQGSSDGRAHPFLVERLRVAEAYLHQRHGTNNEEVIKKIGWNKSGGLGYENKGAHIPGHKAKDKDDKEIDQKSHQHTMGLAIDIDPGHNPWVYRGGGGNEWMDRHLAIASKLYGGTRISNDDLNTWSAQLSTEELHAKVASGSSAFKTYLSTISSKSEAELAKLFEEKKVDAGDKTYEELAKDAKKFEPWFHSANAGRANAATLTNINMDLLIALRDVAGLNWGGTEMGHTENGDFMHFDCRNTQFGRAVVDKESPADREARLQKELQARQKAKQTPAKKH